MHERLHGTVVQGHRLKLPERLADIGFGPLLSLGSRGLYELVQREAVVVPITPPKGEEDALLKGAQGDTLLAQPPHHAEGAHRHGRELEGMPVVSEDCQPEADRDLLQVSQLLLYVRPGPSPNAEPACAAYSRLPASLAVRFRSVGWLVRLARVEEHDE